MEHILNTHTNILYDTHTLCIMMMTGESTRGSVESPPCAHITMLEP